MIVQVPKRRRSQRKIGPSLYCRRAPLAATGLEVAQRGGGPEIEEHRNAKRGGGFTGRRFWDWPPAEQNAAINAPLLPRLLTIEAPDSRKEEGRKGGAFVVVVASLAIKRGGNRRPVGRNSPRN